MKRILYFFPAVLFFLIALFNIALSQNDQAVKKSTTAQRDYSRYNQFRISSFKQPLIVDHHAVEQFQQIPDTALPSAIGLRLMFRHASVGGTVNDGLNCLQGTRTSPKECTAYPQYKYDRRNWAFQPRSNSGWYGKIDDFVVEVNKQMDSFDIFSFKYCYLDALDGLMEPCGSPLSVQKVEKAWNYLRDNIEALESKYPDKLFIWWSIPLTQVGQYCTDTLNSLIRSYCREKGKVLFDIADLEAYDPDGVHCVNTQGWEIAFKDYCGEQNPGAQACHPNWTGKILLSKAFWWMMTQIGNRSVVSQIEEVPENPIVLRNYPNPFYSSTSISFTLMQNENVTLRIYDILGREIITLINETLPAGTHVRVFDGSGLPGGIYRCQLSTPTFSKSNVMEIIR